MVGLLLISLPAVEAFPKREFTAVFVSRKFLLLRETGKGSSEKAGFFLYLLNFKRLQFKIIFLPTMGFQVCPYRQQETILEWSVFKYLKSEHVFLLKNRETEQGCIQITGQGTLVIIY